MMELKYTGGDFKAAFEKALLGAVIVLRLDYFSRFFEVSGSRLVLFLSTQGYILCISIIPPPPFLRFRDEDPTFFSTDPDPAGKKCRSGPDLKSK